MNGKFLSQHPEPLYFDGAEKYLYDVFSGSEPYPQLDPSTDWPVLYHLSPLRENLLNWFPFNPQASLLEVGAGCGALTGLFADRCARVIANELTEERAEIIRLRYQARNNIQVHSGNIQTAEFAETFDYVTCIGVLEYAERYQLGTANPYRSLLSSLRQLLSEQGVLLLAIENKFGLKYWAGAREDHSGQLFDSLEDYPSAAGIRTFSRNGLLQLLKDSGYSTPEFYYPLPDYKLPTELFSDSYLPTIRHGVRPGILPVQDYAQSREHLFDERRVMDSIVADNSFPFFANSFLLIARPAFDKPTYPASSHIKTSYVRCNSQRRKEFRLQTTIECDKDTLRVFKKATTDESRAFLQSLVDSCQSIADSELEFSPVPARSLSDWIVEFPHLDLPSLNSLLLECIRRSDRVRFLSLFDAYREKALSNASETQTTSRAFEEIFGDQCRIDSQWSMPGVIDLNFDNIYCDDDCSYLIDYEWTFPFAVPADYPVFRAIISFYWQNVAYSPKSVVSMTELFERAEIDPSAIERYLAAEFKFQQYVYGEQNLVTGLGFAYFCDLRLNPEKHTSNCQ